ncbi:hypothetical protein NEHOM01_0902 [Nematocida homosporus]|uniref:uncharacterized protein n=1 Tax=Nematocida homosporus TaxID=1912981 RepID=UPI00221FF6FE|nr:uncharacterized protein NEHOM01_0902 [Nematocida homosporus]KAI5185543.1 hypothetical protein NEHOM01_0902 [Nematocida homosporus]
MNNEEKLALAPNEVLCATIGKIYSAETGEASSSHISYIIKRASLSMPVVLCALYLAVSAREKAAQYIGSLREEMEAHIFQREELQKKIDTCLQLCENSATLFSICLIIASKYLVDRVYINRTWANILMMDKSQINAYERILLHVFDHNIDISETSLKFVLQKVHRFSYVHPPKKEGKLLRTLKNLAACLFKRPDAKH